MKKTRFSVEQMIGWLKQARVGVPVAEVNWQASISEQTFYRSEAKFAGLQLDQVRQIAKLCEENLRLESTCANLELGNPCQTMLHHLQQSSNEPTWPRRTRCARNLVRNELQLIQIQIRVAA